MARALKEFEIEGVKTLIPFHKAIMASEQWAKGETCRDLIEDKDVAQGPRHADAPRRRTTTRRRRSPATTSSRSPASASRSPSTARRAPRRRGNGAAAKAAPKRERKAGRQRRGGGDTLASPMQGNIFKVLVEQGAEVEEGALVCIIEAMKMENEITAHKAGKIAELRSPKATRSRAETRSR